MDLLSFVAPETRALLPGLTPEDPGRGERLLERIGTAAGPPPEGVPFLETLLSALAAAPDPELALVNLERWTVQLSTPPSTLRLLRENPGLLADLLCVFGSSDYLAGILAREPGLYSLFSGPDQPRDLRFYRESITRAVTAFHRPEARREALRRVKRRELLRIGWRDLARRAPLEEVIREISQLAEALVAGALTVAADEVDARFPSTAPLVRFAAIAMGKLGAGELNYSSDIDLMFVMDGSRAGDEVQHRYASRLAETLVRILSEETGEGRCFRVDLRLRPEGRNGALVRSFAAYRTYYDRWAETWERQALIKARPIAGDAGLGRRFRELVRPVVYRRLPGATVLEDIRETRFAVERKLEQSGELERHVKEGRGTIRDVEFTVQLLQLLFGADHPALQVPDTLTALRRLQEAGGLSTDEGQTFEDGYRFFRATEHHLQLLHDLPVRLVPTESRSVRRLARSMGFSEAEPFLAAYRAHSAAVRTVAERIHSRLTEAPGPPTPGDWFSGGATSTPLRGAALAADTPEGKQYLDQEFRERGITNVAEALRAFVRLAVGSARSPQPASTRRMFGDLAGPLLDAAARSADPAGALEGFANLADRKLHRSLYQRLREDRDALEALVRLAGSAPAALRVVLRYPELTELVQDPEQRTRRKGRRDFEAELAERLTDAPSYERRLATLRRYRHREFVRLAARHVLAPPELALALETNEWSDLADALIVASLQTAVLRLREQGRWSRDDAGDLAVLALGRLGGGELHFASDLDLLFVYRSRAGLPQQAYEALARRFNDVMQLSTDEGRIFALDLRLRPEGRRGFSVHSLEGARHYYGAGGRAQTWEFQSLTRMRTVAGSAETAAELHACLQPRIYRTPAPEGWRDEIRGMKLRIERERVTDESRDRNLKLGPGGLSDVEFVVQYLQLAHGGTNAALRCTAAGEALRTLAMAQVLAAEEYRALADGKELLTRLRQELFLLEEDPDLLPDPSGENRLAHALARAMGYSEFVDLQAEYRTRTAAVRAVFLHHLGS